MCTGQCITHETSRLYRASKSLTYFTTTSLVPLTARPYSCDRSPHLRLMTSSTARIPAASQGQLWSNALCFHVFFTYPSVTRLSFVIVPPREPLEKLTSWWILLQDSREFSSRSVFLSTVQVRSELCCVCVPGTRVHTEWQASRRTKIKMFTRRVLGTGCWGHVCWGQVCWVLVLGGGCWGNVCWELDAGCWVLGAGCWVLGARNIRVRCWVLGT